MMFHVKRLLLGRRPAEPSGPATACREPRHRQCVRCVLDHNGSACFDNNPVSRETGIVGARRPLAVEIPWARRGPERWITEDIHSAINSVESRRNPRNHADPGQMSLEERPICPPTTCQIVDNFGPNLLDFPRCRSHHRLASSPVPGGGEQHGPAMNVAVSDRPSAVPSRRSRWDRRAFMSAERVELTDALGGCST